MAFKRLDDLYLIEEYCIKPKNKSCPLAGICYSDEFQCKYWKQVFKNKISNKFIIRQGNNWKAGNNEI